MDKHRRIWNIFYGFYEKTCYEKVRKKNADVQGNAVVDGESKYYSFGRWSIEIIEEYI